MPESITVTAEGGIEYELLCNNDHQFYSFHHHSDFDIGEVTEDGFKTHYVLIKCEEIRTKFLPNSANPRDPSAGGVVTEMQQTLTAAPEKFYQYNGGITIACSDVTVNPEGQPEGTIRIDFGAKDGICNGGHTYFSIQTMDEIDDKAVLLLEILQLPENMDEIEKRAIVGEIARKRNKNRQLKTGTQLNHQGHFDIFKERIRTERYYAQGIEIPEFEDDVEWEDWIRLVNEVYWYEGDPMAFDNWEDENTPDRVLSSHFIRLLASMDPCLFQHPVFTLGGNGTHQNTATGDSAQGNLAKMIREAVEDPGKEIKKMRHMAPLAYDILKFRDHISCDLAYGQYPGGYKNSSLWNWFTKNNNAENYDLREFTVNTDLEEDNGLHLPANAYPLIAGLFRHNVWLGKNEDGEIQFSGWYELLEDTYDYVSPGDQVLRHMQYGTLKDLMEAGDDGYNFIRNNAVYHNHWIGVKYGMEGMPKFPCMFNDVDNYRLKYESVEEEDNATHVMKYPAGPTEMFVEITEIDEVNLDDIDAEDYALYSCQERDELIPNNLLDLGWQMKNVI